jgi:hypothetical protein
VLKEYPQSAARASGLTFIAYHVETNLMFSAVVKIYILARDK